MQEGLAILIFAPLVGVTLVALFAVVAVLFQRHVSAGARPRAPDKLLLFP